jgi:transcriptional regulator with XRE-family HTH domain
MALSFDKTNEDGWMSVTDESVRDVLAVNLRRARTARDLSLSELSRLSKIGKATLSALEAGAGNPTIETVFSLSRALGVPISDLLDQRHGNGLTVVRGAEVEILRGEGVDLRPLRGITTGDTVFEVYDQRVRSHQESLGHLGTEHTIVQAGRLGVRVDDHEVELGPGDYVGFDAMSPHTYTPVEGPVRSVLLLHYRSGQRLHSAPVCAGGGAEPQITG